MEKSLSPKISKKDFGNSLKDREMTGANTKFQNWYDTSLRHHRVSSRTIAPRPRVIAPPKKQYFANEAITAPWFENYPMTLDDRIKRARERLEKMSKAEKWELIRKSYGMWEDYPEDWLEKLRSGSLEFETMRATSESEDVFFS